MPMIIFGDRKVKPDRPGNDKEPVKKSPEAEPNSQLVGFEALPVAEDDPLLGGVEFTECQLRVAIEFKNWFCNSSVASRRTFQVLSGYAGTGKTFLTLYLIKQLVSQGLLSYEQIIGCGPTHTAVNVLKSATEGRFGDYKTLASLLSLRPDVVEWDLAQEAELQGLIDIAPDEISPDQAAYLKSLQDLKSAAESFDVKFTPARSIEIVADKISSIRLIVLDESSMIDAVQFALLNQVAESHLVHPEFQVLMLGDPAQLPPVGEKVSRAIQMAEWEPMTKVKRYDGPILQYCTELRSSPIYDICHNDIPQSEQFLILPYNDGIRGVAECVKNGDDIRVLAATNEATDRINYQVRRLVTEEEDLIYKVGDRAITKSPISRDSYGKCRARPSKKNKVNIYASTSTLLEITQIVGAETWESPLGNTYERIEAMMKDVSQDAYIEVPIFLVNPNQWTDWAEEQRMLYQMYSSTFSKSRAKRRGQEGKLAQSAWDLLGIKNWNTRKSGAPISESEYQKMKRRLMINSFECRQFADEVTYSYCTTVHRAQGAGFDVVALDMSSLTRQSKGGDGTWDTRKLLYTAATRARKQLILMV